MLKIIITFFFLSSLVIKAGEPELITDRPDQTESSSTVPKNSIQIEDGLLYEIYSNEEVSEINFSSILFRYGLLDWLELRLGSGFIKTFNNSKYIEDEFNIDDLVIGGKAKLFDEDKYIPELAVLFHLNLPISTDSNDGRNVAPGIIIAGSYTLSETVGFGFNIGPQWDGVKDEPDVFYAAVFGFSITEELEAFLETYGNIINDYDPEMYVDAGFTYLIQNNMQFDLSGGLGVNSVTEDYFFISTGFTIRLPK